MTLDELRGELADIGALRTSGFEDDALGEYNNLIWKFVMHVSQDCKDPEILVMAQLLVAELAP